MSINDDYAEFLDNEQKEIIFLGFLTSLMAIRNYRIRTPVPDIGQDILIAHRKRPHIVIPAQLKSVYSIKPVNQGRIHRYLTNIIAPP